jgi:hypothetical protein
VNEILSLLEQTRPGLHFTLPCERI